MDSKTKCELRNKLVLGGGIGKGGNYYNQFVFFPCNENGYRDYRYYQPTFCISRSWPGKNSKLVNIRYYREGSQSKSLMNQRSEQTRMMWERLKGVDCLRELVILLSDKDLDIYRESLVQLGYSESRLESMGKKRNWYLNYISADFYFPDNKIIFELDSEFHIPDIDKARDRMLLKQYGIKTYRFFRYDLDPYSYESSINIALNSDRLDVPLYFNQIDLIMDRYIQNPEILNNVINDKEKSKSSLKGNWKTCRDCKL